jgi:hypothetical protein
MISPNQPAVYFALVYIHSSQSRTATLLIGSNDAIKVYYNYNKVYTQRGGRTFNPDQGRSFIKINKGWNKLLLKIENSTGRFGFYARVLDRENLFQYDLNEELPSKSPVTPSNHIKRKWRYKGF